MSVNGTIHSDEDNHHELHHKGVEPNGYYKEKYILMINVYNFSFLNQKVAQIFVKRLYSKWISVSGQKLKK